MGRYLKSVLIPDVFLSDQLLSSSGKAQLASMGDASACGLSFTCMHIFIDMHSSSSSAGILQIMTVCVFFIILFFK